MSLRPLSNRGFLHPAVVNSWQDDKKCQPKLPFRFLEIDSPIVYSPFLVKTKDFAPRKKAT